MLDVDEKPVFTPSNYTFSVLEDKAVMSEIGRVSAKDPDKARKAIRYGSASSCCNPAGWTCCLADLLLSSFRYSILEKDGPIGINPVTGQLSILRKLDRELEAVHMFQVKAQEEPSGKSLDCTDLLIPFPLNNRFSHENGNHVSL